MYLKFWLNHLAVFSFEELGVMREFVDHAIADVEAVLKTMGFESESIFNPAFANFIKIIILLQ